MDRFLATNGEGGEEHFGVHIAYADLYASVVFLMSIYTAGLIATKICKMPALVGEIFCGICLGPNLLNAVPNVESFVMLGEIGLILLVLEAGIDIDFEMLKLIGKRGLLVATVGTFLPILIAFGLAYMLGFRGVAAIATGCSFAPTSLGIAMNVLRQSKMANTPVGQLIVAAAIIDDMIALVILSQLQAFTGGTVTLVDMVVPIFSALAFLFLGGYVAVSILPNFLNRYVLEWISSRTDFSRDWVSMCIMFLLLVALIPSAYYGKASPLMGAFLAGLVFCSDHGAHTMFVSQFKRIMQWLLRIFFAASIGFQVPVKMFAEKTVLLHGFIFTLALLGKVACGFLSPNFAFSSQFRGSHLRDCLVIGFSMAAEGEFAFVIAAFAVTNAMITQELYASIVLAVLISTIIAPLCLRTSISYFSSGAKQALLGPKGNDDSLETGILQQSAVFYCLQTKSAPAWGIQVQIVKALSGLELDVIDHRSWHPHKSGSILVNEIYMKEASRDMADKDRMTVEKLIPSRIDDITRIMEGVIQQADAVIKLQRWYPDPFLPDDTSSDINQRIVAATGTALNGSMKDSTKTAAYTQMMEQALPASKANVCHLDMDAEGRLDGLIRHDFASAKVLSSGHGFELLDSTYGSRWT